jgi:hypothetical protein
MAPRAAKPEADNRDWRFADFARWHYGYDCTLALMDMTIGTGDERLNEIRREHAACKFSDCEHLRAFAAHEDSSKCSWRNEPTAKHRRPAP